MVPSDADKPRPLLATILIAGAVFVGYRAFVQTRGMPMSPLLFVAHFGNVVAVCALALRWLRPPLRKSLMIVAIASAAIAFLAGQRLG